MTPSRRLLPVLLTLTLVIAAAAPLHARDWFVDNSAAPNGDGSAAAPLQSLRAVQEASGPGDAILLRPGSGPYRENLTLKESQILTGSSGRPVIAPAEGDGIVLAPRTSVTGVTVRVAAGAAIRGQKVGENVLRDLSIETAGDADGIVLVATAGAVTLDTGSVKGSGAGTALKFEGGAGAITVHRFPVTIRNGAALAVRNREGTVVLAEGSSIEVASAKRSPSVQVLGSPVAVDLTSLSVDGAGVEHAVVLQKMTGHFAASGGTIRNIAQRGIVVTQAENVTLRNMTLEQASTVDGTRCGRPVAADDHLRCNGALYLHDTDDVTLDNVAIRGAAQNGIHGDVVRNFTMTRGELTGAGDELDEAGVLLRNATGNVRFIDTRIIESAARQIEIVNDTGEADIEVTRATVGSAKEATGQQGILISGGGDARVRVSVSESTVSNNPTSAVHVVAQGKAVVDATIRGSRFQRNGSALVLMSTDDAKLTYRVESNTVAVSSTTAITITTTSKVGSSGAVTGNTVGVAGQPKSGATCNGGCAAIMITGAGRGNSSALVARNTIQQSDSGVRVRSGDTGTLDVRIAGNTIRERSAGTRSAIHVQAGMRPKDSARVCAEVGGAGELANHVSWGGAPNAVEFLHKFPQAKLFIAGYAGAAGAPQNAARFVAGRNRGAAVTADVTEPLSLADTCDVAQEK